MDADLTLPLQMSLCLEPQGTQSLSSSIRKRRVRGFKNTNHEHYVYTLTVCESEEETGAIDLDLGFGMGRGERGGGRGERKEGDRGGGCRTSLKVHEYTQGKNTS